MAVGMNTFENIFGKEKNAADQHLSFSHNLFYPFQSEINEIHLFCRFKSFQPWYISNFVVW